MVQTVQMLRNEISWLGTPHNEAVASTVMAFCLRSVAVAHYDLHMPYSGYPNKLAKLLLEGSTFREVSLWQEEVAVFLSTPMCCLDPFSKKWREMFHSEALLRTKRAQMMLHMVCEQLDTSTYSTERLHSSNARRARSRTFTHELSLPQMAAYQSEAFPLYYKAVTSMQPLRNKVREKRKAEDQLPEATEAKRKRGGGGSWRSFLHVRSQGDGRPDWHRLSEEYSALTEDELSMFHHLDQRATLLHREGQAFPRSLLQHSAIKGRLRAAA